METNPELQQFLDTLEMVDPLQPRNAFFGGRRDAVKLHHVIERKVDEKIKYIDVTPLYPWVNKTQEYPVGHPEVLVNPEDQDIRHHFGMAKVDILHPTRTVASRLAPQTQGQTHLSTSEACMQEEMAKPLLEKSCLCRHTPERRTLRGEWCTPEIQKAEEMGYTLIKIHEVYHFLPEQRQKGLFAEYVNTWL